MSPTPGEQTITIHKFFNISPYKGNQTIKSGQVIEYERNIYLQKLYRKGGRQASSRPLFVF